MTEVGSKPSHIVAIGVGRDRPGLVAAMSSAVAAMRGNIEDFDAVVLRGNVFVMSMVVDVSQCAGSFGELEEALIAKGKEVGLSVSVYSAERLGLAG